jgi:hypothetical protein
MLPRRSFREPVWPHIFGGLRSIAGQSAYVGIKALKVLEIRTGAEEIAQKIGKEFTVRRKGLKYCRAESSIRGNPHNPKKVPQDGSGKS